MVWLVPGRSFALKAMLQLDCLMLGFVEFIKIVIAHGQVIGTVALKYRMTLDTLASNSSRGMVEL